MNKKKLIKIFENVCLENDLLIEKFEELVPVCFLLKKNGKIDIVSLFFRTTEEKEFMRNKLMRFAVNNEIDGYILIFDTNLTQVDMKNPNREPEVSEAVVRTLYTPKGVLRREFIFHKNKKILKKVCVGEQKGIKDSWDLWGERVEEDEHTEKYSKFRDEHPEKYK